MASGSLWATDRHYCIAADEIEWDFAPSFPINLMTGQAFTIDQMLFVNDGIGRVYTKAVYRQYANNGNQCDWGTIIDGPAGVGEVDTRIGTDREHLGILGPVIRAAVGDTIFVHFRNNASFPTSVHPHGVFYAKDSEGAPYADGTSGADKADDAVPTGGQHLYIWPVPKRAGPARNDSNSVAWVYHSHTDETADTNAGLIGAIIISKDANSDGSAKDVKREFVSLFTVFNENASSLFSTNIAKPQCGGSPTCLLSAADFEESNLMHGINGRVWANNSGYNMTKGKKARWYIIGMGTEVDLHTPHWHGNTLTSNGNRVDVAEVLPAASKVYNMKPDNRGTWMYHCHVNDHIDAGMTTVFTVQ